MLSSGRTGSAGYPFGSKVSGAFTCVHGGGGGGVPGDPYWIFAPPRLKNKKKKGFFFFLLSFISLSRIRTTSGALQKEGSPYIIRVIC